MRTIFERIVAEANSGWKPAALEPKDKGTTPVGSYFIYQKEWGAPINGGTQPIWSYNLSKILDLWKEYGGYVFSSEHEIIKSQHNDII
jgi:hypothetical protein